VTDGPADLAGRVDALYAGPPEEFTPGRAALVKALKADGQKEAAAEIGTLRKPTAAAWAVNRLVQADDAAMIDALDAAGDLRAAQRRVLSGPTQGDGGAGEDLRAATGAFRAAVRGVVDAARDAIGRAASPAVLDKVASTVQAAATSEAAEEAVRSGRLVRELDPAGMGDVGGLEVVGDVPTAARARPGSAPRLADGGRRTDPEHEAEQGDASDDATDLDEAERAEAEAGLAAAEAERLADTAVGRRRVAKEAARVAASAARDAAAAARKAEDAEDTATAAARAAKKAAEQATANRRRADEMAAEVERLDEACAAAADEADEAERDAADAREAAVAATAEAKALRQRARGSVMKRSR
jgi:hypothetical protein